MTTLRERDAAGAVDRLADAFEDAIDSDAAPVRRLAYVRDVVRFVVGGADAPGVTLDLTGDRPRVDRDQSEAGIQVAIDAADADAFRDGQVSLLELLASGRATAEGPVRRYLEVDPIVRALLATRAHEDGHEAAPRARDRGPRTIDPSLAAITTRGLKKSFGRNVILDGLDITIPEGSISVVLGPSGTGKSVLLRHIIGILEPDEGEVLVRGRSLRGLSDAETLELRCDIGVMFQDGALFSNMDVYENVAFPLREHTDLDDREIDEVVLQRLEDVGLGHAARLAPAQLSGGMRKRVGLARALVLDPGIVLVDEPDSGLDPVRTALLGELLVEQHAAGGGTMLIVTHNVGLARFIAGHVSVLWKGKVVADGLAEDVFDSEDPFVKQFLAREIDGPLGMD